MSHRLTRRGLTLFEIAISMAIIAVAVTAVALAFPIGIRAQRLARFRIYAGTKVLEVMDHFVQHEHLYIDHQVEAERLGQCQFPHQVPIDLDALMMSTTICGLYPLPQALARRIDSDGDEIARLLDQGGRLYYPTPRAYEAGSETMNQGDTGNELPTEAQALLFAVVGTAQQNALPNHPCLAWPYQDFWPSPPQPWERETWTLHDQSTADPWPMNLKAAFDDVFSTVNANTIATASAAQLGQYLVKAQALMNAAGVAVSQQNVDGALQPVPTPPADLASLGVPWCTSLDPWGGDAPEDAFPRPWKVLAMRYLASAAVARTGSRFTGADAPTQGQRDYARQVYDAALAWAMRYAATNPYDWGAPRPLNRQIGWDEPLLQYDLFPSAAFPLSAVGDGTNDVSWRIVAPFQPRDFGQARGEYSYSGRIPPNHDRIAESWGDASHLNLTAPFEAAERDREIVCWAVDWRSWQDFETAPSDPYDASSSFMDSRGNQVISEIGVNPPDIHLYWRDANRNSFWQWPSKQTSLRPETQTDAFKATHLGMFGVDRNGNGRCDTGPVPVSARQRAVLIGRWHYYDRRLIGSVRN